MGTKWGGHFQLSHSRLSQHCQMSRQHIVLILGFTMLMASRYNYSFSCIQKGIWNRFYQVLFEVLWNLGKSQSFKLLLQCIKPISLQNIRISSAYRRTGIISL